MLLGHPLVPVVEHVQPLGLPLPQHLQRDFLQPVEQRAGPMRGAKRSKGLGLGPSQQSSVLSSPCPPSLPSPLGLLTHECPDTDGRKLCPLPERHSPERHQVPVPTPPVCQGAKGHHVFLRQRPECLHLCTKAKHSCSRSVLINEPLQRAFLQSAALDEKTSLTSTEITCSPLHSSKTSYS